MRAFKSSDDIRFRTADTISPQVLNVLSELVEVGAMVKRLVRHSCNNGVMNPF